MNWAPNTTHQLRQQRATMLKTIRDYFYDHEILEVETPALSQAGNTDPYIESHQTLDNRYLQTSPEYPMKRLLAAGSGDIYQIAKVWRAGEVGSNHNPEFTLLEWYRVGFSYQELMQEVSKILLSVISPLQKKSKYITYKQLFLDKFGINPHITTVAQLKTHLNAEISSLDDRNLDKQAMLDALLTHCIEPEFDPDCLTFVYDYPASQSALAQLREDEQYTVAERFEVYLGSLELGNGYQEEVDALRNATILKSENDKRRLLGLKTIEVDTFFLQACENNIPACSGVAIGLDRVLMGIAREKSIQKVINFPWDKA